MRKSSKRANKLKEKNRSKKVLINKLSARRDLILSKIKKWDAPELKMKAEASNSFNDNLSVAKELIEVLNETKEGVGLASNQIGSLNKVFVTRPEYPQKNTTYIFINPEIVRYSVEKTIEKEGCLSYPEHYCDVERSEKITIKYTDENKIEQLKEFSGWHARIIQHEYDHNMGLCLVGDDFYKNNEKA